MLDSCGTSGTGETPQARLKRAEDAHRPHQGKRASWSGNQLLLLRQQCQRNYIKIRNHVLPVFPSLLNKGHGTHKEK
ncbi:hypothetical protein FBF83_08215 [Pseudalkalibacillus hwajinpoensis]|uniref:Uncharacterized protein n=1 Tax=Guptibacillus hwajinpoensis TaxID=208199 RepID=A0A4U1MJE8_9BACL|nr:hypothetical protein FBF83_08215 [Pseudalkalibacillus hwajinpoensis]